MSGSRSEAWADMRADAEAARREAPSAGYERLMDEIGILEALKAENYKLRKALHHISLSSQNSMSSKEEGGRIAREALGVTPGGTP